MEDDLNIFENGRRPQFFRKWKTTSIFLKMEDDLNFLNDKQPFFCQQKNKNKIKNNAT